MDSGLNDKNIIKSTLKVFNLLEILVNYNKLSLSKLSKLTGYTMSSTQRILNTLRQMKYIEQDMNTNEYFPSIKLYELGNKVVNNIAIKNVSKPHLIELYNEVDETVNLGILDNESVVYLDKIVSKSPLRAELDLGIKFPIYCSALGKVMAAFKEDSLSFNGKYLKYTENTILTDDELNIQLKKIKMQGYAIDNEEYVKGLICISVPILNLNGNAIASISISIPSSRFDYSDIDNYVNLLKKYSSKIQNDLY